MVAEGEGRRRGADKKRRTNERGSKDKRGEVHNGFVLLRAHGERRGHCVKNNLIPPSPVEGLNNAKQQVVNFFLLSSSPWQILALYSYIFFCTKNK